MFYLWKLKLRRRRLVKSFNRAIDKFADGQHSDTELLKLTSDHWSDMRRIDGLIDQEVSNRMLREAIDLDLEVPNPKVESRNLTTNATVMSHNFEYYHGEMNTPFIWLTSKGRLEVRRNIDAEKARRFEVKMLWVTKFWLPILAALTGLGGVAIGIISLLRHAK